MQAMAYKYTIQDRIVSVTMSSATMRFMVTEYLIVFLFAAWFSLQVAIILLIITLSVGIMVAAFKSITCAVGQIAKSTTIPFTVTPQRESVWAVMPRVVLLITI